MHFRNTNTGILLRRWIARWLFYPVYLVEYISVYYKLFIKSKSQPLFIVLTIGKVGSSSVYYSIKEQLTSRVFHIHYISEEGIKSSWEQHKNSSRKSVPLHLITSKILNRLFKKVDEDIYFITVFREPLQRKLSSFFQNLDQFKNEVDLKGLQFDVNKASQVLNNDYFNSIIDEEDKWIEQELIGPHGFSIYHKNEIEKNNYVVERKENLNLLILKMETLNDSWDEAISKLYNNQDSIELITVNDGGEKYYNKAYKAIKNTIKLDKQILENLYGTRYFKTFYEDQKSELIETWIKR
ncbi:putative capsular polysaccharide synthesis family protein [Winogradskyella tangerina]|uniref:putative capsular polysaccharide synthesis family protein n=1 Tax=Winogradskyella tangerina TaxID=2023240 RepID=UPI00130072A6|nr:putative capsular polysaccharide synthesis family protein [Winogradskyella tangerina]